MDSFLQILSDPNLAYLLLTLGVLGLLAEFFHPGAILPGVAGAIALILAFTGLGQLPFSWGGLALLGLAAGLVVFELTTSASGILIGVGIVIEHADFRSHWFDGKGVYSPVTEIQDCSYTVEAETHVRSFPR